MIEINGVSIELHADDYGQTLNTTEGILELMEEGLLDGISILPNMPCAEECFGMLVGAITEHKLPFLPMLAIHIDLVEGRMLSALGKSESPADATDAPKLIPWTWKSLFFASYPFVKKATYKQVKAEVEAQLSAGKKYTDELLALAKENGVETTQAGLRIDSHQHAHMLPIVWKAIAEVIAEKGYDVEYVRNSHEPLGVFLKHNGDRLESGRLKLNPVGIVKNRILAFMAPRIEKWVQAHSLNPSYLWGLIMTGHMDMERIEAVMPDMLELCKSKGRDLEINIHPGIMLESEKCPEVPEESARDFYMFTENRLTEADTVRRFGEYRKDRNCK